MKLIKTLAFGTVATKLFDKDESVVTLNFMLWFVRLKHSLECENNFYQTHKKSGAPPLYLFLLFQS